MKAATGQSRGAIGPAWWDEPAGHLHSSQGDEIMALFKKLDEQGTTILQVTHSEKNATYGNRIVRLLDGWIVED